MSWTNLTTARTRLPATALLAALSVSVAACGGGSEPGTAAEGPTASPTQAPSPTAASTAPSATPTSAAPSVTASPTSQPSTTVAATEQAPSAAPVQPPPPGSSPREMLLGKTEIPGLNEQHRWRPIATENSERRRPIWACQVTDFASIGATDVWVRRFVGDPGGGESARARSAVLTFVDETSAQRAYAVLRAWHDRCEEQLSEDYRRVRVDAAPTAVQVEDGQAEWRLAIYGPVEGDPDAGYFDATGYVREGNRISLTTIVSAGQDYNYPQGEEPIVGAVRNSAIKLLD
jgi:hypothetical protein